MSSPSTSGRIGSGPANSLPELRAGIAAVHFRGGGRFQGEVALGGN